MRNSLFLIPMAALFSCNSSSSEQSNQRDTSSTLSTPKQTVIDSNLLKEEKIAINSINFGINEKEFNKEKELFIKKTETIDWISENTGQKFYKYTIGGYKYDEIGGFDGYFSDKKLYKIEIAGHFIHYDKYNSELKSQIEAVEKMFKSKYGMPVKENPVPKMFETNNGYMYLLYAWNIGNKAIEVRLNTHDEYYSVDIHIYQRDIEKQLLERKAGQKDSLNEKGKSLL